MSPPGIREGSYRLSDKGDIARSAGGMGEVRTNDQAVNSPGEKGSPIFTPEC